MGYDFGRFVGQLEYAMLDAKRNLMSVVDNDQFTGNVELVELRYDILLKIYEAAELSYWYDDD